MNGSARALLVPLGLLIAACGESPKAPVTPPVPAAANPQIGGAKLPPPSSPPKVPELSWVAPAAWKQGVPMSGMRLAQWDVATDEAGDPVQCIVFGSIGGSDEDNLARWTMQMGPSAASTAKTETTELGGVKVTRFAAKGAYTDSMRPGQPKSYADASFLGAIVATAGGKVHVKLVGPTPLIDAATAQFDEFLASMRPK